jgi:ATP phosphoribosyltransferase
MKAAGLKAIDTVVSSVAVLVKSKNPSNPALVDLLASRIRGVISKFFCHLRTSPVTDPR